MKTVFELFFWLILLVLQLRRITFSNRLSVNEFLKNHTQLRKCERRDQDEK